MRIHVYDEWENTCIKSENTCIWRVREYMYKEWENTCIWRVREYMYKEWEYMYMKSERIHVYVEWENTCICRVREYMYKSERIHV